jgi:hypothetical protein
LDAPKNGRHGGRPFCFSAIGCFTTRRTRGGGERLPAYASGSVVVTSTCWIPAGAGMTESLRTEGVQRLCVDMQQENGLISKTASESWDCSAQPDKRKFAAQSAGR